MYLYYLSTWFQLKTITLQSIGDNSGGVNKYNSVFFRVVLRLRAIRSNCKILYGKLGRKILPTPYVV